MRKILIILFMAILASGYGQSKLSKEEIRSINRKIDSLSKVYSDTILIDNLIAIAKDESKNNPNVSIVWIDKVDSLFQTFKAKPDKFQVKILLTKSRYNIKIEQLDSADSITSKALGISFRNSDSLCIADCYSMLGIVYWKKNRSVESIHYSVMANSIYERFNKKIELSQTNNLIGIVHQSMGDFDKSIEYFLKALTYAEAIKDTLTLSKCYNNLGASYRLIGELEAALRFSKLSLKIKEKQNDKSGISSNLSNIGGVYFDKGDYKNAIDYSQRALQIDKEINNTIGIITNYFNLARSFFELNELAKSKKYLQACIDLCKLNPSSILVHFKANYLLSHIFEKENNYKLAYRYLSEFSELKDSLMGIEKRKTIAEMELRLNFIENNKKIDLLENEKAIKDLEIRKTRLFIVALTSISLLLFLLLYIQIKSKKDLKFKNQIINVQHNELEKYKNHLEELVEEKSRDLKIALQKAEQSSALKSSFLNNLSHEIRTPMNAVMGILNVINAEKNGEMEPEIKIVNSSFNQLLFLIDEILLLSKLQTDQVDIKYSSVSLKLLFQDIVNELKNKILENKKDIEVEFEFNGDIIVKQDPNLILKMFQLIIDNAVKYTDSGKISLGYRIENSKCIAFVKDTGVGIDEMNIKSIFNEFQKVENDDRLYNGVGIGLSIVKKISKLVDTPISIESKENKGTIFFVEFPHYTLS